MSAEQLQEISPLQKVLHFFLTRIIIGVAVLVALVALIEWLRSSLLDKTNLPENFKSLLVAVADAIAVTTGYILLFRTLEKRRIHELSAVTFLNNAFKGFFTGIILQAIFVLVIYVAGSFLILYINPVSTLITPFAFALTAGFVAEIILIGVVFRLLEEKTGTMIALLLFIVLFAVLHINAKGATIVSVAATAMQAGFMLPAAFVFSRSLWLPVFIHFGWDFAEPGIFGGINPSTSITEGLLTTRMEGNWLLTGGVSGPQDSLPAFMACLLLGSFFLILAKRKNNFIEKATTLPGRRL